MRLVRISLALALGLAAFAVLMVAAFVHSPSAADAAPCVPPGYVDGLNTPSCPPATGPTRPPGTAIAFQSPAVGVSASGVGRLEVQFDGTFETACIYWIAGTGLMPRTQVEEVSEHGEKVHHGPVAADGTFKSSPIYRAPLHSGTLSATARDGSTVTTQYLVPCSPQGAGHS